MVQTPRMLYNKAIIKQENIKTHTLTIGKPLANKNLTMFFNKYWRFKVSFLFFKQESFSLKKGSHIENIFNEKNLAKNIT